MVLLPFFLWNNAKHHHSGIGYLTPNDVHYGRTEKLQKKRQEVLSAAYAANPHRFVKGLPRPPQVPQAV